MNDKHCSFIINKDYSIFNEFRTQEKARSLFKRLRKDNIYIFDLANNNDISYKSAYDFYLPLVNPLLDNYRELFDSSAINNSLSLINDNLGKDNFTKIPNGCGTVENRMEILWHFGVNAGRMTPNEFVALTSANAAKIFNIYPKKGRIENGADADIVVWDPQKQKTISAKTHHMNVDANIFEGITVTGSAVYTLSHGKIVFANGELKAEKGNGQYVKRPKYS